MTPFLFVQLVVLLFSLESPVKAVQLVVQRLAAYA